MQVIISELAAEDIRGAYAFYARQDAAVAERFVDTVMEKIFLLESIAGIHMKIHDSFRMLAFPFPYAIYYIIESEVVTVRAVLHCRRSPHVHATRNK
ncbi:MAG: type II toxin-antitoxin system RelE/ParE family toxin [Acidobacteriota bacterium]|jgi:plasmid stabilization system protein ParE|nr:type II toxin-antitoxin system RelE/ParE family toxin [Acidobacteriota bacterium]